MSQRASAPGRRTLRDRKVSQRVAVVDESTRQQAVQARLDALEADNDVGEDAGLAGSDDEFVLAQDDDDEEEEVEISDKKRKKRKQGAGASAAKRRQLRTSGPTQRMPRSFARLLEEAALDRLPPTTPTYLTAQAGPSVAANAARKFCSVCGTNAAYKCPRCSSRYCCRKCYATHVETRCLKFLS